MTRKQLLAGLSALLIAIVTLQGCKPEGSDPDGGANAQDSIPVHGDWIRAYHTVDPDGLHPMNARNAGATFIKENIYMYLSDYNPQTLLPEPTLAKSAPEISADGLSFTYEMRAEARWDNGDPITGEDYAFSIKCLKSPLTDNAHQRSYFSYISDVKVDPSNNKRFTVVTNAPFFLAETGIAGLEVLSHQFYDSAGVLAKYSIPELETRASELANDPALLQFFEKFNGDKYSTEIKNIYGSGPYKVESWTHGDNVTLVRKKDWWGDKVKDKTTYFKGYAEKLIYKTIVDKSTVPMAAQNGELDVMRDMSPDDFMAAKEDTSGYLFKHFNFYSPPTYMVSYLGFNCKPTAKRSPALADLNVRKAFSYITDIDGIISNVYNGMGQRQVGPISPLRKDEYDSNLQGYRFDPEKAKALLDEAGWVDSDGDGVRDKVIKGKKVKLEFEALISNSSETGNAMLRMIADQAQKVGMVVNVNRIDFTALTARLRAHDFDVIGLTSSASPLPTDLKQLWATENWANGGSNYFGFGNASTDSLIEQIRQTPLAKDRTPLYHKFQAMWLEQLPTLPIMVPTERILIHKRFHNALPTSLRPGYKLYEFWTPVADQKFK